MKLDFTPSVFPSILSGPATGSVGRPTAYQIEKNPFAKAYQWRAFETSPAQIEDAEHSTNRIIISQTGTYDVIQNAAVHSGSSAFHLTIPDESSAQSQYLTLLPTFVLKETSTLSFQSRLGFASPDQHARVQLSTNGGFTWETVYDQQGTDGPGDQEWQSRSVSLWNPRNAVHKFVQLRFAFDFFTGNYYPAQDPQVGWLIDDIQFFDTDEITAEKVADLAEFSKPEFQFTPARTGTFYLQARTRTGHLFADWGNSIKVNATSGSLPQLRITSSNANGQFTIIGSVPAGNSLPTATLESTDRLEGTWTADSTTVRIENSTLVATPSLSGGTKARFFRFRMQ